MKFINITAFSNWRRLFLFAVILLSKNTFATHNTSAYINCEHVSGYTYKITAVTFTNSLNAIDRCELTLRISNGDSIIAIRVNGPTGACVVPAKMGTYIGNGINLNIYEAAYTFTSQNVYTISFNDANRNQDIINIPNSLNTAFYIETKLYVFDPNVYCTSNSIGFAYLPISQAYYNTKYESDVPILHTEGDSLTYQLAACMSNGEYIQLYTIPTGMTINQHTGRITWLQPNQIGLWSFAVLVKKWRQNVLVGTSTVDYTITVLPNTTIPQYVTVNSNCTQNTDSTYSCNINPTDTVKITLTNPNSTITLYTEIDTTNKYTFANDTATFNWNTTALNARHNPYKLTFRHDKVVNNELQTKDITFFITLNDTATQPCTTPPNLSAIKKVAENVNFIIYPNPTTDILNITYSLTTNTKTNIQIINSQGQIVTEITQQQTAGKQTITIDTKQFAKGLYYIQVANGENIKQTKIIIQ